MSKKILWILPLCLSSHTMQITATKEKQAIVSWIKADEANGTLTPAEAKTFLGVVENYSSYNALTHDLQTNVMGSLWFKPWYEVSLKHSLLISTTLGLYQFFNMFGKFYSLNELDPKRVAMEIMFDQHGYSYVKGTSLFSCIVSFLLFTINFMLNFALISSVIFLGGHTPQSKEEPKYRLCRYLIKRGLPLYTDYYNNFTKRLVVGIGTLINYLLIDASYDRAADISFKILGIDE